MLQWLRDAEVLRQMPFQTGSVARVESRPVGYVRGAFFDRQG